MAIKRISNKKNKKIVKIRNKFKNKFYNVDTLTYEELKLLVIEIAKALDIIKE